MKKCPYCAEEIQDDAIKCKYCGEWLEDRGSLSADKEIPSADKPDDPKAESINELSEKQQPPHDLPKTTRKTLEQKQKIPRGWGFLILLSIFGTGIKKLSYPDSEIGAMASFLLPIFAIVFLLFFYFWLRKRMIRKGKYEKTWMASFVAGFVSYFATLLVLFPFLFFVRIVGKSSQESHNAMRAIKDYRSLLKDFSEGKEIEKKQSPQSYGEISQLVALMKNNMILFQQDLSDFNAALEKESFSTILSLETFSNQNKIIEARYSLKKINQILADYEKLQQNRRDELINEIKKLDLPDDKKQALEGAFREKEKADAFMKKYFRIESEFIAEMDKMLIFLDSIAGEYEIVGEKISFNSDEDSNQYNQYLERINQLAEQEDKLNVEYQQILSSKVQKLDEIVRELDKSAK